MSEDGFVYEETKENEAGVKNPRYAWYAPIGGLFVAILFSILYFLAGLEAELSEFRAINLIIALLPGAMFVGTVAYGVVKTAQCFKGKRHLGHGIAGAIVCSVMIFLIYSVIAAVSQQRAMALAKSDPQYVEKATPEMILRQFHQQVQSSLPAKIDEVIDLVGVDHAAPLVLRFRYVVSDRSISSQVMKNMKPNFVEYAESLPLYEMLKGKGATLLYVFDDVKGNRLLDFEVRP